MSHSERFDIEKVAQIYQKCLEDEEDILLEAYLMAYEEINKFFTLMGSVFSFVSSDIRSKLDILTDLRKTTDDVEQFRTIKSMIMYEIESEMLKDARYVSGSRTLLRLHRGLEFVYEFLERVSKLNESEKVVSSCKCAYNDTLAKYHPWVIRKGASVAMLALPTRGELLKRVCSNADVAIAKLPDMLIHIKEVYDRTQNLYTIYDLHGLP